MGGLKKIQSISPERASFLSHEALSSTPLTRDDTNIKRAPSSVISEEMPEEQTGVCYGSTSTRKKPLPTTVTKSRRKGVSVRKRESFYMLPNAVSNSLVRQPFISPKRYKQTCETFFLDAFMMHVLEQHLCPSSTSEHEMPMSLFLIHNFTFGMNKLDLKKQQQQTFLTKAERVF